KMDLVVFSSVLGQSSIAILLGNGDGSFSQVAAYPAFTYFVTGFANPFVVVDFNEDGKPDLALIINSSLGIDVMLANGDGTFRPAVGYFTNSFYYIVPPLLAGDFNGDGKLDLLTIGASGVLLLAGAGDGTFAPPLPVPTRARNGSTIPSCCALIAGDFNGD